MSSQESAVPFLLAGETANRLPARVQPEGYYDPDRQVWIGPYSEPVRAGQTSTLDAMSIANNDTKVDSTGYDET